MIYSVSLRPIICIYIYIYIYIYVYIYIGKAVPFQAWSSPDGSRKLRFPDFTTTAQDGDKVVSLTHRPPFVPEMLLVLIYVRGCMDPRARVRSEGFYVNENSSDTSWDPTSDLPISSTAP